MPLPNFPINEAYLVGAWCAAAVWGVYTLIIGATLYFTFVQYAKTGQLKHKTSTTLVTIIWILATVHLSIGLRRLIEAFILLPPDSSLGSIGYLANIGEPLNRNKDMLYITILFLSDTIIVWRCWVVWGRNWAVAALPMLMAIGTAVAGYGAIAQYWIKVFDAESLAASVRWGTAMFAVSLATNSLVTLLTAARIWMVTRRSSVMIAGPSRTRSALLLLIESGAFVFSIKLLEFILFKLTPDDGIHGLNALYVVFEVIPQVVGLMPTLIVFTVNARVSITDYMTSQNTNAASGTYAGGPLVFNNGRSGASTTIGGGSVRLHGSTKEWSSTDQDIELGSGSVTKLSREQ